MHGDTSAMNMPKPSERNLLLKVTELLSLLRLTEAMELCNYTISVYPQSAAALNLKGIILTKQACVDEAITYFTKAVELNPNNWESLSNRGSAFIELKRFEDAYRDFRFAARVDPSNNLNHLHTGVALSGIGEFDKALECYESLLAKEPQSPLGLFNKGNALTALGRHEEALAAYSDAVDHDPDFADAQLNRAFALLRLGNFTDGWPAYEWRLRRMRKADLSICDAPEWQGEPLSEGEHLLVYSEQGYGDCIQFCRLLLRLTHRGIHLTFKVRPPLLSILKSLDPSIQIISEGEEHLNPNYQCPLLSLAGLLNFNPLVDAFETPYLHIDNTITLEWARRLGRKQNPRVGICWAGNPLYQHDSKRTLPLAQIRGLICQDIEWISLQKETAIQEGGDCPQGVFRDFHQELTDFQQTGGLVMNCDLVVTVDTSVAHLAGALGVRTWLLLPKVADFRWMINGPTSPWYPNLRIFRQKKLGEWSDPISEVRVALQDLLLSVQEAPSKTSLQNQS